VKALIVTSSEFDSAIDPTDGAGYKTRNMRARIEMEQLDVDAYIDATAVASSTDSTTTVSQTHDNVRIPNAINYATFEDGRLPLNETFKSMPASGFRNIGWWSDNLCDANGDFTVAETLTYTWTSDRSSVGATIIFNGRPNEYAKAFTIKYYDASDVLLETVTETANTETNYLSSTPVANYRKMVISFTTWAIPYRRARVVEVLFGLLKVYDDTTLGSVKITEELDISTEELTKNILEFSVNNSTQEYDPINPSGIFEYIQKRQKATTYIGVVLADSSVEYAPTGVFYLVDWTSARTGQAKFTTSFTAHDRIELLDVIYRKGRYATDSIGNLIEDILTEAGVTSAKWDIETALYSIDITTYLKVDTVRNLLHELCLASQSVCRVDRYDVIRIYQETIASDSEEITQEKAQEPEIKLLPVIYDVSVDYYSYEVATGITQVHASTRTISSTVDVWVEHTSPIDHTTCLATVTGGTLNSATYYACSSLLNITASGSVDITLDGYALEEYVTPVTVLSGEEDGDSIAVSLSNVTNEIQATNIADWLIANGARRKEFNVSWKQNPALEVGDEVSLDSQFGASTGCTIVSQTFEYHGGLKGTTIARK